MTLSHKSLVLVYVIPNWDHVVLIHCVDEIVVSSRSQEGNGFPEVPKAHVDEAEEASTG